MILRVPLGGNLLEILSLSRGHSAHNCEAAQPQAAQQPKENQDETQSSGDVSAPATITAAAALGAAFGHPGVANAQPNNSTDTHEWDIEEYDSCPDLHSNGLNMSQQYIRGQ